MFVKFVSNQEAAPTKRIRHTDGKEYLIAPTISIVEGVMNEILYLEDEIDAYIDAWNGRPLVFSHPTGPDGEEDFISANSPEIFAQSPGFFFGAGFGDDRLKGEWWIDVAKSKELGGDAARLMAKLESGEIVEQSTGLFTDVEETSGEFNGEHFTGIARNIRPDHIAILLDEIGACSVEQGCGTPRVNEAVELPKSVENEVTQPLEITNDDVNQGLPQEANVDLEQMKADIIAWHMNKGSPFPAEMLEVLQPEQITQMWEFIRGGVTPPAEVALEDVIENEADPDILESELPQSIPEPVTLQPVPAPVPVIAPLPAPVPELTQIVNADKHDDEEDALSNAPAKALAMPPEIQELLGALSNVGGVSALRDMLNQFKASADEEIAGLMSLIMANTNFVKQELAGLSVEHLRKLAANVCQPEPNYAGRGGMVQPLASSHQDNDGWTYGWSKEAQ